MQRIAEQSYLEEVEPEEIIAEEEGEWYQTAEEYLKQEEGQAEEEFEGTEELEDENIVKEKSGAMVAEKLMEHILEGVAQITETVEAPPPSPSDFSDEAGELTPTDLEGGGS